MTMDIEKNRAARKWSRKELLGRFLWTMAHPLFAYSPRLLWGWRRVLLRMFGAQVGSDVHIHPSARIFIPWNLEIGSYSSIGFGALIYNLGRIKIGERVTISQCAHLCGGSHDFRDLAMPLLKLGITIEDEAWICADAFIAPEVTIGKRAVVGARSVVVNSVASSDIIAGNPAKVIGTR